jgi:hypothetical protein
MEPGTESDSLSTGEIASFEMPPPYGTCRKVGLKIRLTDGRQSRPPSTGEPAGQRPRAAHRHPGA